MLSSSRSPKLFWGEAMRTSSYLINLSPSVPLEGDVSQQVWRKKDVSYKHLQVFGCKAFMHISKELRSKLDDKSMPCIFLDYVDEEFGYRLLNPKNKNIYRSRDVIFREDHTIEDFDKSIRRKVVSEQVE